MTLDSLIISNCQMMNLDTVEVATPELISAPVVASSNSVPVAEEIAKQLLKSL